MVHTFGDQLGGDMIVLPYQVCLSTSRSKLGFCNIFSPSQVASSMGNHFHCNRYSLMVLFLSLISLICNTFSGTNTKWPSSFKGGSSYDATTCWLTAFFKHDTWKTLFIFLPDGSSTHRSLHQFL